MGIVPNASVRMGRTCRAFACTCGHTRTQYPFAQAEELQSACEEGEDSDSWMEAQGEVVEQELAKRQAEMEEGGPGGKAGKAGRKNGGRCVAACACLCV